MGFHRILNALVKGDVIASTRGLIQAGRDLYDHMSHLRAPGVYEVLSHHTTLELLGPRGNEAIVRRNQTVRFLQNHVAAITDHAWGDGEIFAEYDCSPGKPADFFQDGSRHTVLISLREIKNRGDELTFEIRRRIVGGFREVSESWETDVYHRIRRLSVTIVFPKSRPCSKATVIQHSTSKTVVLGNEHFRYLQDGRQELRWVLRRPTLHDRYTLRWRW